MCVHLKKKVCIPSQVLLMMATKQTYIPQGMWTQDQTKPQTSIQDNFYEPKISLSLLVPHMKWLIQLNGDIKCTPNRCDMEKNKKENKHGEFLFMPNILFFILFYF